MISSVYLETTSLSFLVLLVEKCMVHPFVLQMHQTKLFSLVGETEEALLTFCIRLMGLFSEHLNLGGSCKQL